MTALLNRMQLKSRQHFQTYCELNPTIKTLPPSVTDQTDFILIRPRTVRASVTPVVFASDYTVMVDEFRLQGLLREDRHPSSFICGAPMHIIEALTVDTATHHDIRATYEAEAKIRGKFFQSIVIVHPRS